MVIFVYTAMGKEIRIVFAKKWEKKRRFFSIQTLPGAARSNDTRIPQSRLPGAGWIALDFASENEKRELP